MQRLWKSIAAVAFSFGLASGDFALAADPTPEQVSFINLAATAGLLEVEAANVAVSHSENRAVKEFAYRILYEYEKINADLARIAEKRGVTLSSTMDAKSAEVLGSLRAATTSSIDKLYLDAMVAGRTKLVQMLESNLLNPDAELAVFSSYNLPRIREHKRRSEELKTTLPP